MICRGLAKKKTLLSLLTEKKMLRHFCLWKKAGQHFRFGCQAPDSPGTHRVKEQCCALHRARIATTFCHSMNDIIDHAKLCFAVRESPPACPGQTSTRARPLPACPHPDPKTVSLDTMPLIRGRSSPMHARARPLFRTHTDMRAQPLARPRTAQPLKRHLSHPTRTRTCTRT